MHKTILSLIKDDKSPSMYGILTGLCKGDHWSIRENGLTLDVAYSYCVGGCGVVGQIPLLQKPRAKAFFEQVFLDLTKKGILEFEFSSEDEALYSVLLDLFSDKEICTEEEYSYRKQVPCTLMPVAPSYKILEVDKAFLQHLEAYEHADLLLGRLNHSWNSPEDFLTYSKCFVATKEKTILGIIFGSARFQNIIAIDIEVLEAHRRKGLAAALTSRFVNACLLMNCIPQWDCIASNTSSQLVAKKCGLKLMKKRPYYWFSL